MSDRLALAHAIEEAGIAREKAEDIASAVVRLVEGGGATKADLLAQSAELKTEVAAFRGDLKADIAAVKADLAELRTASRADLQAQGTELKAEIAVVRAELQAQGAELKADTSAARAELRILESRLTGEIGRIADRNFRWLLGIMLGGMLVGFIAVLGAIAYGFHWL